MPFVRSFDNATPPARFDDIPFSLARIEESAAADGPFSVIDSVALSPTDTDPAIPASRDLTTDNATLEQGYYRIVWEDDNGAQYVAAAVFYGLQSPDPLVRLRQMVAPDLDPVLSDGELEDLLSAARRPDRDGILPSEAGWTTTYDLDSAAAAAWEMKAARAAGGYDFGEDGQRFNESQIHAQCMAMAKLYRRGSTSVFTSSVTTNAV